MRRIEYSAYVLVVIVLAFAPYYLGGYQLSLLGRFLAMSILALGLSLVWGNGGILSLGQGVFFALGGYSIAMYLKLATVSPGSIPDFMQWNGLNSLPWFWEPFHSGIFALASALILPTVTAAGLAWLVFRRRVGGVYFAIITQALVLAFTTFIISQQPYTDGFNGLTDFGNIFGVSLMDSRTQTGLYWVTLALLAILFMGMRWLLDTHYGKLLRAIRDGENRVRFLGYDPVPYKVLAFAIGGTLAGIAGVLFTLNIGVISPAMVGVMPSIEMVVWVAVGGRESPAGAIIGTLLVNFGKDGVSSLFPDMWLYVMGMLFVLVVTVLPDGIAGLFQYFVRESPVQTTRPSLSLAVDNPVKGTKEVGPAASLKQN